MKISKNFIVRDYIKGDEKGITALFNEVFGKKMSIEEWEWKYLLPGKGKIYSKVTTDLTERIIAHAGALPLRGVFQGRPIQFFQMTDVMLRAEARGFIGREGIYNTIMKRLIKDLKEQFNDIFFYGGSGIRPFTLGKRIGLYDKIENAFDCITQIRPTLFSLYRIEKLSWNDNRLDALWAKYSNAFPLSLIRDRDYLKWRYALNPFFSYQLLGVFLFGKLHGWVVIRDAGVEVLVIDLLTERNKYVGVVKALGNYLTTRGMKSIRIWLPELWRKNINGYSKNKTDVIITHIRQLAIQTSIARDNLYYTMGDLDIF